MGLAASQARFLAITSRKAYCEFESMQLAQDKLSVTRDLADVSKQYQDALNQTKLVWDYDGTGENPYNLSYDVLMTPSILNNYTPYLITNRTGAVVLDGQLAAAAAKISSTGVAVEASASGFKTFINALADNGVIPESTAQIIRQQEYNKKAGYGGEPLNKNGALVNNIVGLAYQTQEMGLGIPTDNFSTDSTAGDAYKLKINGSFANAEKTKNLTISDLLTNDVVYIYTLPDGKRNSDDSTADPFKENVNKLLQTIKTGLSEVLGTDVLANAALNNALTLVQQEYLDDNNIESSGSKRSTSGALNNAVNNASHNNGYGFGENTKGDKTNSSIAINLSNLVAAYLTYFELCYNGFESNYNVGATVDSSYFVTDDPNYNYLMTNNDEASENLIYADFYMQLYNNICHNGWTECDDIDDNTYLQNALKNGTYFITSLNTDGYFYQGRYNEIDCIVEVEDSTAIAEAEAEFNAEKTKLTYREEKLDLEMKNLDTEISSLTTEYDSVKNLISKSVEKVFTMFQ